MMVVLGRIVVIDDGAEKRGNGSDGSSEVERKGGQGGNIDSGSLSNIQE